MQLVLFSRPKPLVERFGRAFFREVPKRPGVYLMRDGEEQLVYVGKATNLRQRLGSYRYVNERTSRRMLRLLNAVVAIQWEIHESEPAACIRENELLRLHRPKFNRANVYPHAYPFIEHDREEAMLRLTLEANEDCFGAFKGARAALESLQRLLWMMANPRQTYADLPRRLLLECGARTTAIQVPPGLGETVHDFLAGTSDQLLRDAEALEGEGSIFHGQFRAADIETLRRFYERGPRRNRAWLDAEGVAGTCVAQERVNDLAVKARM